MDTELTPERAARALAEVGLRRRQIRAGGPRLHTAALGWAALVFVGVASLDFLPRSLAAGLIACLALLGGAVTAWYAAPHRWRVRGRHAGARAAFVFGCWGVWHALVVTGASLLHAGTGFAYVFTTAAALDVLPLVVVGLGFLDRYG